MAKIKFDGVIESVRYKSNGEVEWVRAYERRGPAFSDYVLLDRKTLVERIKAGKKFFTGRRIVLMGSSFEVSTPVQLVSAGGRELLSTSGSSSDQDRLEGVPVL